MRVTPIIAPELFDRLIDYAKDMEKTKEPSSQPPLDFCDAFFAQFFQNRMKQEIKGFGKKEKEAAIKLRHKADKKEKKEVVQLITWFEEYSDIRYDVFSEEYGGGTGDAISAFHDYLKKLLQRISAWAKVEKLNDIGRQANAALSRLTKALKAISK